MGGGGLGVVGASRAREAEVEGGGGRLVGGRNKRELRLLGLRGSRLGQYSVKLIALVPV
jgi:hypothetical protein